MRHISGMQRYIRRNAGHDSSEPNVEMQEQAAGAPRPVRALAQHRRRVDPRRRMPTWKLQRVRQDSRRVLWSVVRTLEAEDDTSAKRQKLMASMPILHETDVDVNMDAHKLVVMAAMPDGPGKWTQQVIDWDKKYQGAKSGTMLDTQKVYEGRFRERARMGMSHTILQPLSERKTSVCMARLFACTHIMVAEP